MAVRIDAPAPPVDHDRGGGDSEWVQLFRAAHDIEAHLLGGRLGEAGIESQWIKDRSGPSWLIGGSDPWAPVTIMVRRYDLIPARIVLAEIAYDAPAADTTEAAADPSRMTWKRALIWWALALGLGILFTGTALMRTADTLESCDLPLLCGETSGARP